MRVASSYAVGDEPRARVRLYQKIDAIGATGMAALDEHRLRSKRQQTPRLLLHLFLRACHRHIEQCGGFRQIRRKDARMRAERALERLARLWKQKIASSGRC